MKDAHLQIRLSADQKRALKARAKQAGQNVSEWVLSRVLSGPDRRARELLAGLSDTDAASYVLAELNSMLQAMSRSELEQAFAEPPPLPSSPRLQNHIAAMIELAAHQKQARTPPWTVAIEPLRTPWFASTLTSLRLHLLHAAPPPFRRRNIFVDASVGDQV